eukprot:g3799.t1
MNFNPFAANSNPFATDTFSTTHNNGSRKSSLSSSAASTRRNSAETVETASSSQHFVRRKGTFSSISSIPGSPATANETRPSSNDPDIESRSDSQGTQQQESRSTSSASLAKSVPLPILSRSSGAKAPLIKYSALLKEEYDAHSALERLTSAHPRQKRVNAAPPREPIIAEDITAFEQAAKSHTKGLRNNVYFGRLRVKKSFQYKMKNEREKEKEGKLNVEKKDIRISETLRKKALLRFEDWENDMNDSNLTETIEVPASAFCLTEQLEWENMVEWGGDEGDSDFDTNSNSKSVDNSITVENVVVGSHLNSKSNASSSSSEEVDRNSSILLRLLHEKDSVPSKKRIHGQLFGSVLPPPSTSVSTVENNNNKDTTSDNTAGQNNIEVADDENEDQNSKKKTKSNNADLHLNFGEKQLLKLTNQFNQSKQPLGLNVTLAKGDWLRCIFWDDDSKQGCPEKNDLQPLLDVVLDSNDRSIVFDHKDFFENNSFKFLHDKPEGFSNNKRGRRDSSDSSSHPSRGKGKSNNVRHLVNAVASAPHSAPARRLEGCQSELTSADCKRFHRIRYRWGELPNTTQLTYEEDFERDIFAKEISSASIFTSSSANGNDSSENFNVMSESSGNSIQKLEDLSAHKRHVILVEYVLEERPLLLSNVGMADRMINFHRPIAGDTVTTNEFDDGEVIQLGRNERLPLLGDIEPGEWCRAFCNEMYKMPIWEHEVPNTDFLMVNATSNLSSSKSSNTKGAQYSASVHLREIPAIFAAGQQEPMMCVPQPNSRKSIRFTRDYITFWINKLFNASRDQSLDVNKLINLFPTQNRQNILKCLKQIGERDPIVKGRKQQFWIKKKDTAHVSEDHILSKVSPDMLCGHYAMVVGLYNLRFRGIKKLYSIKFGSSRNEHVKYAVDHLRKRHAKLVEKFKTSSSISVQQVADAKREVEVAEYIYHLLQITPWNLSSNFVSHHIQQQGTGVLELSGKADPTGRDEGYSYIPVPIRKKRSKKKNSDKKIRGTDKDLRTLTSAQMRRMLKDQGMKSSDIKKLKRWELVDHIRKNAGHKDDTARFVRKTRLTTRDLRKQYRAQCDARFAHQMSVIRSAEVMSDSGEESSDENDLLDDLKNDIEDGLLQKQKERSRMSKRSQMDERKELDRMRQMLAGKNSGGQNRNQQASSSSASSTGKGFVSNVTSTDQKQLKINQLKSSLLEAGLGMNTALARAQQNRIPMSSTSTRGHSGASSRLSSIAASGVATPTYTAPPSPKYVMNNENLPISIKNKRAMILKRTITRRRPDGTKHVVYEYHKNEDKIRAFMAKKNKEKEAARRAKKIRKSRRKNRRFGISGSAMEGYEKKVSRSIQEIKQREEQKEKEDELAYLKREDKMMAIEMEKLEKMIASGNYRWEGQNLLTKTTQENGQLKWKKVRLCSKCKFPGHTSKNAKKCPKYRPKKKKKVDAYKGFPPGREGGGAKTVLKLKKLPKTSGSIKLTKLRKRALESKKQTQRKKQKLRAAEEDELYQRRQKFTLSASDRRARKGQPHSVFNTILTKIIDAAWNQKFSIYFRVPVNVKKLPDYAEKIKNPMHLTEIKGKLIRKEYLHRDDFLADFDLIIQNSVTYNGPFNVVTNLAKELKKYVETGLSYNKEELDNLEAILGALRTPMISTKSSGNPGRTPASTELAVEKDLDNLFSSVDVDVNLAAEKLRQELGIGTERSTGSSSDQNQSISLSDTMDIPDDEVRPGEYGMLRIEEGVMGSDMPVRTMYAIIDKPPWVEKLL